MRTNFLCHYVGNLILSGAGGSASFNAGEYSIGSHDLTVTATDSVGTSATADVTFFSIAGNKCIEMEYKIVWLGPNGFYIASLLLCIFCRVRLCANVKGSVSNNVLTDTHWYIYSSNHFYHLISMCFIPCMWSSVLPHSRMDLGTLG